MLNNDRPNARGIMFVSLSSSLMTPAYISRVEREALKRCDSFMVCLLDEAEVVNQVHLWGRLVEEARREVEDRANRLRLKISATRNASTTVLSLKEYSFNPTFSSLYKDVTQLYKGSNSFKNHCHSQIFRNLQPILNQRLISNKRHRVVASLSPYILQELTLKLFISSQGEADIEFAPRPEMDLLKSIYAGRYSQLSGVACHPLPVVIVEP